MNSHSSLLLSTAFFPPVSWFSAVYAFRREGLPVCLEACEHYKKQTYRNRCRILSSSGVSNIIVPTIHDGSKVVRDIKIDYSDQWPIKAWRTIASAYGSSAYFQYYAADIKDLILSGQECLWDLNLMIINHLQEKIGATGKFCISDSYRLEWGSEVLDLRDVITPKAGQRLQETGVKEHPCMAGTELFLQIEKPYFQVFAQKHGFKSDLSILDLLFNEGPDAVNYLE